MLKNLFSMAMALILCMGLGASEASMAALGTGADVQATQVAVLLDTPSGYFAEPEKVYESIQNTLNNIFKGSSLYKVQPLGETDAYLQIYREEHDLANNMENGYMTVAGRDLSLKKENVNELCKSLGADYVIYTRVTNSMPRYTGGFWSAGQKVNVVLDFRVWSNKKEDYVYTKRTTTTGSSSTFYVGGVGSSSHAVEDGLKKGLQEVEKDATKIRLAMIE